MASLPWSGNYWNHNLRIGISVFDKEHRDIVDALNQLKTAVEAGDDRSITTPLLEKLASYTRAHFKDEEEMMGSSKYPGAMLHALKHQDLLVRLNAFQARHGTGGLTMDRHSLSFLHDWVTTHIESEDLNFSLWLNEHGKR